MKQPARAAQILIALAFLAAACSNPVSDAVGALDRAIVLPLVESCSLTELQAGVSVNPGILIRFSQPMDAASVAGALSLERGGDEAVETALAWSEDGAVLSLAPRIELFENNPYVLRLSRTAKSREGHGFLDDWALRFMTGAKEDTAPPTVVGTSPEKDAADINRRSSFIVYFSEAMDEASVAAPDGLSGAFGLFRGNARVAGSASWVGTNLVFQPSEELIPYGIYALRVEASAKDAAGNALGTALEQAYSAAGETVPPTVIGVSPIAGAANVSGKSEIIVYFSEAMDRPSAENAFSLIDSNSAAVAGSIGWMGNNLLFRPAGKLRAFERYSIAVNGSATDLAGNALGLPYASAFDVFGKYVFKSLIGNTSKYQFYTPSDIEVYRSPGGVQSVFVLDSGKGRILRYDAFPETAYKSFQLIRSWEVGAISDISLGSDGSLYAVNSTRNLIEKYNLEGIMQTTLGTPGTAPGSFNKIGEMAIGSNKHFYVSDQDNTEAKRIQEFDQDFTYLRSWNNGNRNEFVISMDCGPGGELYAVVHRWGTSPYFLGIRKLDSTLVEVANWPVASSWSSSNYPSNVKVTPSGEIAVCVGETKVYDAEGTFLRTVGDGFDATLVAAAFDQEVNLYRLSASVKKYSPANAKICEWGGGVASGIDLNQASDLALAEDDTIFFIEVSVGYWEGYGHLVKRMDFFGNLTDSWPYSGRLFSGITLQRNQLLYTDVMGGCQVGKASPEDFAVSMSFSGGFGTDPGQFKYPEGIYMDASDRLYVVESYNKRLQVFDEDGAFIRQTTGFVNPVDVLVDASNVTYVLDRGTGKIVLVAEDGSKITQFGALSSPSRFAFTNDGDIVVTDSGNNRVVRYTKGGIVRASFGGYGFENAEFNSPVGIGVDRHGDIWVSDKMSRIQSFTAISD
jgi:hypothetical protein